VFRSLITRSDLVLAVRRVDVVRAIDMIRALGLLVVFVTVLLSEPHPLAGGTRGTAVVVMLGLSAAAWVIWMLGSRRRWLLVTGLIGMAAAGGALTGLSPESAAVAISCMATFSAAVHLRPEASLGITAETMAVFLLTGLIAGAPIGYLLGYSFAFVGLWGTGLTRHKFLDRAVQAERMLAETRRAREAEMQAARFAERTRIARDIHDVLAHSLAAVSVNLQAAEGLLGAATLPADNPELVKAKECIDRAATLTREGLAAARRAVMALRDDAAPLSDQLSSLVSQYHAAGDMTLDFKITGEPRPLPEDASLAAYRTVQEALTNARKHAPGQPVTLTLDFPDREATDGEATDSEATDSEVTVGVVNPLPPDGAEGPLAATGAGYGLTGLTERAALVGGTLEAGPAAGSWRVYLRMPV
jgi:signal transduction histidine kinase